MKLKLICSLFAILIVSPVISAREYFPDPVNPDNIVHVEPDTVKQNLVFSGNKLVFTQVLKKQIGYLPHGQLTKHQVFEAAKKIKQYYLNLGYALANVKVSGDEDRWSIHIDEGALESISIFGLGWYNTYKFRTTVLPENIYNVVTLQKNLQQMIQDKFTEVTYELIDLGKRAPNVFSKITVTVGSVLTSHDQLRLDSNLHRYGLNIYFKRERQYSSFRPDINYSSNYGIQLLTELEKESLFVDKDDFYANLGIGVKRLSSIDPANNSHLFFPNLISEIRWFTPPFSNQKLRLYFENIADYITDQRVDLPLDKFSYLHVRPAPILEYQFLKHKYLTFAIGYDYKNVASKKQVPTMPFAIPVNTAAGFYSGIGLDMVFGKPLLVRSFNHKLDIDYSFYYRGRSNTLSELFAKYRKVFFTHVAELHLKASGLALFDQIQFFDEYYLRKLDFHSSFDHKYFIRKGASLSFESRFNIYGNKVQLGVFDDVVIFKHFLETSGTTETIFANSVGGGGYFLFFDAIQAYITYAFGYNTKKEKSHDFSIGVRKLF